MDDNARAPQGEGRQPADPLSFNSPIGALISALVFLYVGYGLAYEGRSGDALYDGSVAALTWGARGIGIALLAVAGLQLAQLAFASMVDAIVTGLAALLCLGVGLVWLMYSDMQGVLLVIFGIVNASATRGAWLQWNAVRSAEARLRPHDDLDDTGPR